MTYCSNLMSVDPHITNNVVTRDTTKFNLLYGFPKSIKYT